jgi:branched-chain amino acid transport system permease protein
VYLATRTFNFAHAQIVTAAGFLGYTLIVTEHVPSVVALGLVALAGAAFLVVEERIAVRPTMRSDQPEAWLVSTLGVSVMVEGVIVAQYGGDPLRLTIFGSADTISVLGTPQTRGSLVVLLVGIAVTVLLMLLVRLTRVGRAFLATAENAEAARLRGIDTRRVIRYTFLAAGVLAGIAGLLIAPVIYARADAGELLVTKVFVVLALGGFGSIGGVLWAGLFISVYEAVVRYELGSEWVSISTLSLLLLVLVLRPHGLFGTRAARVV